MNSFETSLSVASIGDHIPAIFIRAPYFKEVGTDVRVLATIDDKIVAAECNTILVTSFHPELSEDTRVLSYFLLNKKSMNSFKDKNSCFFIYTGKGKFLLNRIHPYRYRLVGTAFSSILRGPIGCPCGLSLGRPR